VEAEAREVGRLEHVGAQQRLPPVTATAIFFVVVRGDVSKAS
jgi:hypothetical protein